MGEKFKRRSNLHCPLRGAGGQFPLSGCSVCSNRTAEPPFRGTRPRPPAYTNTQHTTHLHFSCLSAKAILPFFGVQVWQLSGRCCPTGPASKPETSCCGRKVMVACFFFFGLCSVRKMAAVAALCDQTRILLLSRSFHLCRFRPLSRVFSLPPRSSGAAVGSTFCRVG